MSLTRRQALASAAAAVASSVIKPAIAAKEPIMIGYLPALTGPSSSTGIGINRGIHLAVQEINAAGGIGEDAQSALRSRAKGSGDAHAEDRRVDEARLWGAEPKC